MYTNLQTYYTRSSSYGSGLRKQQQQQMNVRYGGSVSPSLCIDKVDNIIDMPGKGWCFVYVARYSYDPFQVCIVVLCTLYNNYIQNLYHVFAI